MDHDMRMIGEWADALANKHVQLTGEMLGDELTTVLAYRGTPQIRATLTKAEVC